MTYGDDDDDEFPTAQELRERADRVGTSEIRSFMRIIKDAVDRLAEDGSYSYTKQVDSSNFPHRIRDEVIKRLNGRGLEAEVIDDPRDGCFLRVTW